MFFDVKTLLERADHEGFAIPAFNYSDVWEMEAIVQAAEELRAPVMIASNTQVVKTHGVQFLGKQGIAIMELSSVPVINHLDHCYDIDLCKAAIDAGYSSVMIDKSTSTLEDNLAATKEIVAYAAAKNVRVEAEIGRIKGRNAEGTYDGGKFLADIASSIRMATETGITSLAVGIGNAHGFYTEKPNLNFDRLAEINQAVDIPLVLHGGTGIPDADIQKAIRMGINKVNIGTQLHFRYISTVREILAKSTDNTNIVNLMEPVREAVKKDVGRCIKLCMADGKY